GLRDGERRVGDDFIRHVAEQNAVVAALPADDAVAHRLAAVTDAERRPGDLADPEEFLVQFLLRDFVIPLLFDPVDSEDPVVGFCIFRNDLVVWLRFRRLAGQARKPGGALLSRGRRGLRLLTGGDEEETVDQHCGEADNQESFHSWWLL